MKLNPDGKTVAAVDLEVPGAGELWVVLKEKKIMTN